MSVYVIAQLTFKDEARYRQYQARFWDVFSKFKGRLLAADEKVKSLEGVWSGDKVVVMEFDTETDMETFIYGDEYAAISKDRQAGAETISLQVAGYPS